MQKRECACAQLTNLIIIVRSKKLKIVMQNKVMVKVAAVATGLAMATSMLSLAPMAHAASLSSSQVQSIITLLSSFGADAATLANVTAALTGGTPTTPVVTPVTGASCADITAPLTIGSTGAAVTALQKILVAGGYLTMPAGTSMGYFGPLTQKAVMAWQTASGVTPAAGYFGSISLAKLQMSSACTTASVPPGTVPPTTGSLSGTDGTISDVDELGSYNNEEVAEGQNGVKVLGADVEASNDGDIALKSVKVQFDSTGNTGSDNLDDYIDSVDVWLGSTKVGSADVDEFDEASSGIFTKTITLSNAVIRADEVETIYISVDAVNNIDSGDISGDSWDVDIMSIRFEDGSGVVTTDSTTGAIGTMNVGIDFVTFSAASASDLVISTASDSPEAGIVMIDDTSTTDDVLLLKGKIKLEGTSDVVIDEFPVTLTATDAASLAAVTGSVTLKIDGESFTESVSSSDLVATITFDNLDFALDAGDTVTFEVLADINDIDAGNLDEGDTLKADVTATNRNYIDVENEQGDQLSDSSDKSGTATGEAQEFRTNGISVALVGTPTAVSNDNDAADTGTFKIKYKVTAVGDAVYVSSLVGTATTYAVDRSGTATSTGISAVLTNSTDADLTSVGNYLIEEGESETFELTVVVPLGGAATTGLYRTTLSNLKWDTSDDTSPANTYSSNLDNFKTDYVFLDNA